MINPIIKKYLYIPVSTAMLVLGVATSSAQTKTHTPVSEDKIIQLYETKANNNRLQVEKATHSSEHNPKLVTKIKEATQSTSLASVMVAMPTVRACLGTRVVSF